MDQARGLLGSLGRPGLKGWRRSSQEAWRSRTSPETKSGKKEALTQKHPQGSCWAEDMVPRQSSAPCYVRQKSEALGEFIRAWTEVGVWPFRYWTARNKQTSCSRPWPPPCRIQDVCVSSSFCLNTVCGMTCEGGQLWQQELGNLGPVPCLLSPFSLTGSSSSSLLLQALGLTHPHLPLCPQEGPNAGSLQMLCSTDSAGPSAPTQAPFSFPQVICIMVPNPDCQGTLLGLLQPFNSLGYMNFSLLTLSVECMGRRY